MSVGEVSSYRAQGVRLVTPFLPRAGCPHAHLGYMSEHRRSRKALSQHVRREIMGALEVPLAVASLDCFTHKVASGYDAFYTHERQVSPSRSSRC